MSEVNVTQKTQELLSRLPKTDSHGSHSLLNPEFTRRHMLQSQNAGNLLFALIRAREAQELAVSYRDFKVGAAALGFIGNPSYRQLMTGVNMKPDEDTAMNVHAEQVSLQKARDRGFDIVSMLVVVGNTQSDKQSGVEMPTLHPCGLCRGVMSSDPLIDNEATLIVSALPDFSKIEMYNLEALHAFHESHDRSGIQQFDLPYLPTQFDPIDYSVGVFRNIDTPQSHAESTIWHDTVGPFLLDRQLELMKSLE